MLVLECLGNSKVWGTKQCDCKSAIALAKGGGSHDNHFANMGNRMMRGSGHVRTKMNSLFEVQLRLMAQDAAKEAIKIVARHLLRLLWPLVRAGTFACHMVPSNLDAIAGRLTACSLARRVK